MIDDWTPPPFPAREYDEWKTRSPEDDAQMVCGEYDYPLSEWPVRLPQPEIDPFDELEPIDPDKEIPW